MFDRHTPYMLLGALTGCLIVSAISLACSDADVASRNLSRAAEQFEIGRRVSLINGITGDELLVIEGLCSVEHTNPGMDGSRHDQLEVTCKTGEDAYLKHYLGLTDNVTYLSQQLAGADVSIASYRWIAKPSVLLPDLDIQADAPELPTVNR